MVVNALIGIYRQEQIESRTTSQLEWKVTSLPRRLAVAWLVPRQQYPLRQPATSAGHSYVV